MTGVSAPAPRLLQLKIIVGALAAGVVAFAVIAIFLAGGEGLAQADTDPGFTHMLLMVLTLFGLGLVVAYPLIRRSLVGKLRSAWRGGAGAPTEDQHLIEHFQTLTIIGAAMAEGFALFAGVIYLVTAHPAALAGIVIGLLALSRFFPTEASFAKFADGIGGTTRP